MGHSESKPNALMPFPPMETTHPTGRICAADIRPGGSLYVARESLRAHPTARQCLRASLREAMGCIGALVLTGRGGCPEAILRLMCTVDPATRSDTADTYVKFASSDAPQMQAELGYKTETGFMCIPSDRGLLFMRAPTTPPAPQNCDFLNSVRTAGFVDPFHPRTLDFVLGLVTTFATRGIALSLQSVIYLWMEVHTLFTHIRKRQEELAVVTDPARANASLCARYDEIQRVCSTVLAHLDDALRPWLALVFEIIRCDVQRRPGPHTPKCMSSVCDSLRVRIDRSIRIAYTQVREHGTDNLLKFVPAENPAIFAFISNGTASHYTHEDHPSCRTQLHAKCARANQAILLSIASEILAGMCSPEFNVRAACEVVRCMQERGSVPLVITAGALAVARSEMDLQRLMRGAVGSVAQAAAICNERLRPMPADTRLRFMADCVDAAPIHAFPVVLPAFGAAVHAGILQKLMSAPSTMVGVSVSAAVKAFGKRRVAPVAGIWTVAPTADNMTSGTAAHGYVEFETATLVDAVIGRAMEDPQRQPPLRAIWPAGDTSGILATDCLAMHVSQTVVRRCTEYTAEAVAMACAESRRRACYGGNTEQPTAVRVENTIFSTALSFALPHIAMWTCGLLTQCACDPDADPVQPSYLWCPNADFVYNRQVSCAWSAAAASITACALDAHFLSSDHIRRMLTYSAVYTNTRCTAILDMTAHMVHQLHMSQRCLGQPVCMSAPPRSLRYLPAPELCVFAPPSVTPYANALAKLIAYTVCNPEVGLCVQPAEWLTDGSAHLDNKILMSYVTERVGMWAEVVRAIDGVYDTQQRTSQSQSRARCDFWSPGVMPSELLVTGADIPIVTCRPGFRVHPALAAAAVRTMHMHPGALSDRLRACAVYIREDGWGVFADAAGVSDGESHGHACATPRIPHTVVSDK